MPVYPPHAWCRFLRLFSASLLCVVSLVGSRAAADTPRELPYDARIDLPLTLSALGLWTGSELAKPYLGPAHCRWCDDNPLDRSARNALRWQRTEAAHRTSNWLAFGILPLGVAGGTLGIAAGNQALDGAGVDLLVVLEAVAFSAVLNQVVKFAVGRERPFVHALPEQDKSRTAHPADNNTSFYSGHTNLAFTLATAAGTTSQLRHYRGAPYVWAVGIPLAALTGYLRIAADRHYLTDVLVGALLGSAVGVLSPLLLHPPESR